MPRYPLFGGWWRIAQEAAIEQPQLRKNFLNETSQQTRETEQAPFHDRCALPLQPWRDPLTCDV
jgi:hypothetical protein